MTRWIGKLASERITNLTQRVVLPADENVVRMGLGIVIDGVLWEKGGR